MRYLHKGFSLIELMVTLAVLGVALGVALPNFMQQLRNNSSATVGLEFQSALNFARAEAVKRSTRVSICPSDDGETCLTASDWAKGWMVYTDDVDTDGTAATTVETPVRYWSDLDTNLVMTAKKGSSGNLAYLRFNSSGMLARANGADTDERSFEINITNCSGDAKRKIVVGVSGMLNVTKLDCPATN